MCSRKNFLYWPLMDLETVGPKALERCGVPGISVVLIWDATCVWAQGFGVTASDQFAQVQVGLRLNVVVFKIKL